MNKNYICNNGNVAVIDENGNSRSVEYTDNLEEMLIQENLIEEMEKRIKKLGNVSESNKRYIPNFVPAVFLAMIISKTMIFPSMGVDEVINTIFGVINLSTAATVGTGICTLPLAILMDTIVYYQEKQKRKEKSATVAEYEYLEKEIEIQKQKLEELKQDKTKPNDTTEFKVEKVNDLDVLNQLRSSLVLYKNLGYSLEKYYKLYEKGKLEEHLKKEGYTEVECSCVKEYIKEKGPALVKRNKHR